jgi:hypothetical protein
MENNLLKIYKKLKVKSVNYFIDGYITKIVIQKFI